MVVVLVEVLGKNVVGLELFRTLVCNLSQQVCPLLSSFLCDFSAVLFFLS